MSFIQVLSHGFFAVLKDRWDYISYIKIDRLSA